MRPVATSLTVLLAILLTTSLPARAASCCVPQPQCAGCCADDCRCHIAAPADPQPTARAPATLQVAGVVFLPVPALVVEPPLPATSRPLLPATSVARASPAYLLTHAFLI